MEPFASTAETGHYARINGLDLYYEVHGRQGSSVPLIMLHGGVNVNAFGPNLSALASTRQVIAVHLQGHGHTRDIDRPLRIEHLADDIAGLLAHLGLDQADLLGYSFGGAVALQTTIRHPQIVRRLVLVAAAMRRRAFYPEVQAAFASMPETAAQLGTSLRQSPLAQLYPLVDWERLFRKLGELLSQDFDWSGQVEALRVPTMLVYADADCFHPEEIVALYRRLGGGQRDAGMDGSLRPTARLAIVPGTTHYDLLATTAVADLVLPFLEAPLPALGSDRDA